jgi:GNAT superfamily N-acetyltransferase
MFWRNIRRLRELLARGEIRMILRGISRMIPRWIFYYRRLLVLELRERKTFRRYGGVTMRRATERDLTVLAQALGRPEVELRRRWGRKDVCFIAEANGGPVSMTWVSFGEYRLEELDYVFEPGPKGIYLYDAYTAPEWRLKGIFVNLMEYLLKNVLNGSVERVYCAVQHGNDLSLRTHRRFGFEVARFVTRVNLLGWKWLMVKDAAVERGK